ncbi:MAG: divalent-cation tolerance protein CutA [Candidatus Thorarchaeota archaeon]
MKRYVLAITTCRPEEAEPLARALIESRTCACVNTIGGVSSIYRWKGRVERDTESILLIKTTHDRIKQLHDVLKQHHSYEVPEFIVIRIDTGSEEYLNWISSSVMGATHPH